MATKKLQEISLKSCGLEISNFEKSVFINVANSLILTLWHVLCTIVENQPGSYRNFIGGALFTKYTF